MKIKISKRTKRHLLIGLIITIVSFCVVTNSNKNEAGGTAGRLMWHASNISAVTGVTIYLDGPHGIDVSELPLEYRYCPDSVSSETITSFGFPLPVLLHRDIDGGGCGRDSVALLVSPVGLIVDTALYASLAWAVLSIVDRKRKKTKVAKKARRLR